MAYLRQIRGTVDADFGSFPGKNYLEVYVSEIPPIPTDIMSTVRVNIIIAGGHPLYIQEELIVIANLIKINTTVPQNGSGFTIFLSSSEMIEGSFTLQWVIE